MNECLESVVEGLEWAMLVFFATLVATTVAVVFSGVL